MNDLLLSGGGSVVKFRRWCGEMSRQRPEAIESETFMNFLKRLQRCFS